MSRRFKTLVDKMPTESRRRAEKKAQKLIGEMRLSQLRQIMNLTQVELAERMGISQPAISQIESGENSLVLDTLARYISSTGGKLVISAEYPEGDIRLTL